MSENHARPQSGLFLKGGQVIISSVDIQSDTVFIWLEDGRHFQVMPDYRSIRSIEQHKDRLVGQSVTETLEPSDYAQFEHKCHFEVSYKVSEHETFTLDFFGYK